MEKQTYKFTCLKFDEVNLNNRIYKKDSIKINNEILYVGQIGFENTMPFGNASLALASHIVEKLEVVNNELICEIRILETEQGKILKDMIEKNSAEFRICGTSKKSSVENGIHIIEEAEIAGIHATTKENAS